MLTLLGARPKVDLNKHSKCVSDSTSIHAATHFEKELAGVGS